MSFEFEEKILALTSSRREILLNGEKLFKEKRIELGAEKYYDIDALEDPEIRSEAQNVLIDYERQLHLESQFYSEYHRTFLEEVHSLVSELSTTDRDRVLARSLCGLEENNKNRMEMNALKIAQNKALLRLIEIYSRNNIAPRQDTLSLESEGDVLEVENLFKDLDEISITLSQVSFKQKKRDSDGSKFVKDFLGILKNA